MLIGWFVSWQNFPGVCQSARNLRCSIHFQGWENNVLPGKTTRFIHRLCRCPTPSPTENPKVPDWDDGTITWNQLLGCLDPINLWIKYIKKTIELINPRKRQVCTIFPFLSPFFFKKKIKSVYFFSLAGGGLKSCNILHLYTLPIYACNEMSYDLPLHTRIYPKLSYNSPWFDWPD